MKRTYSGSAARRLRWSTLAAPAAFFPVAGKLAWACALASAVLCAAGAWIGFALAPTDHQQGEAYRIIFVHVPAAWMSMVIYLSMA